MRHSSRGTTPRTTALATLAFAAALSAGSAFAHQNNPQCYADGVQVRPVKKFAFTSRQVAAFHAELLRRPPGSCPAGTGGAATKSCGQVDHWHVATIMSGEYCARQQGALGADPRPVAEVTAPPSYLAQDHHLLYTYKAATPDTVVLEGMCVVCIAVDAAAK